MKESSKYIGSLHAHITGDYRYADSLRVIHDQFTDQVIIEVSEQAASGGMDSFSGPGSPSIGRRVIVENASIHPEIVLKEIKKITSDKRFLFKQYGKPTKNFRWCNGKKGLNVTNCREAICPIPLD